MILDDKHSSDSTIVYLDSCANTHVMYNVDMLNDIRDDDDHTLSVRSLQVDW